MNNNNNNNVLNDNNNDVWNNKKENTLIYIQHGRNLKFWKQFTELSILKRRIKRIPPIGTRAPTPTTTIKFVLDVQDGLQGHVSDLFGG